MTRGFRQRTLQCLRFCDDCLPECAAEHEPAEAGAERESGDIALKGGDQLSIPVI
jgi:hypothetical protein